MAGPIMATERAAEARHSVHQAFSTTGCRTTRRRLTPPRGPTARPKITTIHGIVRQRARPPTAPVTASAR